MRAVTTHTKPAAILIVLWLIVQAWVFTRFGILTELEAGKYIREANNLLTNGALSTEGYTFYLLEILVIAIFKIANVNVMFVVLIHLMINALATRYLWKIISGLSNDLIASVTTSFFIVFLPVQQFNFQLQTESLFISLIIFHTYFAMEYAKGKKNAFVGLMMIQTLLVFSRPAGILWTIPTTLSIFQFLRMTSKKKIARAMGLCLLALSVFSIEVVVGKSTQFNLIKPLENGHIICGVSTEDPSIQSVTATEPRSVATPLSYIMDNFSSFLILSAKKTISFFGFYRSYYSHVHNVLLLAYVIPIYILTIIGLIVATRPMRMLLSIPLTGIITTYTMVLLTCDDWHNRFALSVISLFLIICASGIYWLQTTAKWGVAQTSNR